MQIDESGLYRDIGKRLKGRRETKGLSQAWLAARVGLARTSITNIEAGRQRLTVYTLYAICSALECELSDVLPDIASTTVPLNQEVQVADRSLTLPPRTAEFVRSLVEEDEK